MAYPNHESQLGQPINVSWLDYFFLPPFFAFLLFIVMPPFIKDKFNRNSFLVKSNKKRATEIDQ